MHPQPRQREELCARRAGQYLSGLRDAQAGAVQTQLARAAFPGREARWAVPDSAVRSAGSILLDLNLLQKAVNKKAVGFLQK